MSPAGKFLRPLFVIIRKTTAYNEYVGLSKGLECPIFFENWANIWGKYIKFL